ncbi:hypothetical protein FO519_001915 [Halicephalobus sp. NKZ332]|nr:hypothetical protein FO519_001915 [Halicephalobus sp. NKZ332]
MNGSTDSSESSGWSLPLAISLGSINAIVVLGNIFVLYILVSQQSLHTSTNFIVLSLTLADFLLGVIILPFSMLQEFYSEWVFPDLWCKIWLALDVLFSTASIYNLLAISFDRYMAVRQPIKYKFISSNRMTKITIFIVWAISACLAFPPLIYDHFGSVPPELLTESPDSMDLSENGPKICTPMTSNNVYILFSAMVSFILPTIFMILLNISIFQTVQGSRRPKLLPLSSQSSNGTSSNGQNPYTLLRVHRGGGGNPGQQSNREASLHDRFHHTKSASMRGRCLTRSPSLRTNSFRQKRTESTRGKDTLAISVQRKKSSSMTTLNIFAESESKETPLQVLDDEQNWIAKFPTSNLNSSQIIIETEKMETVQILNSYGNGFYPEMKETNIIEKTAHSTIWYPAILTSLLVGRRSKKYSDRFTINHSDQNSNRHSLRTELRVARTIGIVVGCFTVCWLPFTVIYILQAFRTCPIDQCVPGWMFTIAFWLGYANSAVNPLLYAAVSRDFRSAFRKFLTGKNSVSLYRFNSNH